MLKKLESVGQRLKNIDAKTSSIVKKALDIYLTGHVDHVYDLYCYFQEGGKYDFVGVVDIIGEKFEVGIEAVSLLVTIDNLLERANPIELSVFVNTEEEKAEVRKFFQGEFNKLANLLLA